MRRKQKLLIRRLTAGLAVLMLLGGLLVMGSLGDNPQAVHAHSNYMCGYGGNHLKVDGADVAAYADVYSDLDPNATGMGRIYVELWTGPRNRVPSLHHDVAVLDGECAIVCHYGVNNQQNFPDRVGINFTYNGVEYDCDAVHLDEVVPKPVGCDAVFYQVIDDPAANNNNNNNNNGEFIQEATIGLNTQLLDENGNWLVDCWSPSVVRVRQGALIDEMSTVVRITVTADKLKVKLFLNTGNDNQNKPVGNFTVKYKGTEYTADYDTTGMNPTQMQGVGGWCYELNFEFDRRDSDNGGGSSGHHHHKCEDGHKYSCYVCKEPTTEEDGLATWRCERCGIIDPDHADELNEEGFIIISAYPVFNDKLESDIKGAEAGSTVSISTKRWVSVRRAVLEDLAANPGVTLSVKFVYNNEEHTMTIKGDDPKLAEILARQDSFYGLKFLHDYVNVQ